MTPPTPVRRGAGELRRLLAEQTFDLRTLDLAGFRRWLGRRLERWQADPVFVQRSRIRDLRRANPRLHQLETEQRRAAAADAATPQYPRLAQLDRQLTAARRAVAGLTAALRSAAPEKHPSLLRKLDEFRVRLPVLRAERSELARSIPPRRLLQQIEAELVGQRAEAGLDQEEDRLKELLKQRGRHADRSGAAFEQLALTLTRQEIVPELSAVGRVEVLQGVTLGAARVELDQVVAGVPDGGGPVEVLAVVEVKRNPNDLAHGFCRRQENMAWLTGAAGGYDPALYRTNRFRTGHFDREAVHEQGGETFRLTRDSFRRFLREPAGGRFLSGLYFITQAGPLWGVSGANLARIAFRIATDRRWDPDNDSYLDGLLRWCQSLSGPVETPDVLRLFAEAPGRDRQVLVVK